MPNQFRDKQIAIRELMKMIDTIYKTDKDKDNDFYYSKAFIDLQTEYMVSRSALMGVINDFCNFHNGEVVHMEQQGILRFLKDGKFMTPEEQHELEFQELKKENKETSDNKNKLKKMNKEELKEKFGEHW